MKKEDIENRFMILKIFTKTNKTLFDGGYACDSFYENLNKSDFTFYTKVPKDWWFNNGLNEQIVDIRKKIVFPKGKKYYSIKAYRVKEGRITDKCYSLCFKKQDPRTILTNDLREDIAEEVFDEFFKRWDIETCNDELKDNFCFEKLPIKNLNGIIGFVLSSLLALSLVSLLKLKHKKKLGKLFNKGFRKFLRFVILVKAKWDSYIKLTSIKFRDGFDFKWFYESYGFG